MEFELWYLIAVPLLFAAGWYFRGLDTKQGRSANKGLPENYFRGLSLLLSNKPDKAIDAFIEVVKLDPETIELHHALGNLFSKRGEFDRAIRIHTHLINRADLNDKDRLRALSELSDDYLQAGMYDKALECLERLSENKSRKLEALRSILTINCIEHDWNVAIETARRLEKEGGEDRSIEISHFHCELADEAMKRKNAKEAAAEAELALQAAPKSPRALLLAGDIAFAGGDTRKALSCWEEARETSPEHFPLCVARLVEGYDSVGRDSDAVSVLEEAAAKCPSAEVVRIALKRSLAAGDTAGATAVVSRALADHPTLGVLSTAVELRKELNPGDAQLQGLAAMLKKESDRQGRYQCRHCGFLSHSYLWQCPGCGGWDTYPTTRIQDRKTGSQS